MHHGKRGVWLSCGIVALGLTTGCVMEPYRDGRACPGEPLKMFGWAKHPGDTLTITALSPPTGVWATVATTQSSATGYTYGGVTAYYWVHNSVILQPWQFQPHPPYPQLREVRLKVWEGDFPLVTFDKNGIRCVTDKVNNQGEDWIQAGIECQSSESPQLTLRCVD